MFPKCEFCAESAVRLCQAPGCPFQPYMCGGDCNNHASAKVHSHSAKPNMTSTITIADLESLIVTKKGYLSATIRTMRKSFNRIIEQLNYVLTEYEQTIRKHASIQPRMNRLLEMKDSWSVHLTGDDVNLLVNEPILNVLDFANVDSLTNVLDRAVQSVQLALCRCQKQIESKSKCIQALKFISEEDYQLAIPLLQYCFTLTPLDSNILYNLGFAYSVLNFYSKSIDYFSKYKQLNPQDMEVVTILANLNSRREHLEKQP